MDLFTDVALPAMIEELEKIALAPTGILGRIGRGFTGWKNTGLSGGLSHLGKVYERASLKGADLTPFQRFRQGAGAVMKTQMGQAGAAALGGGALLAATPYAAYRMGQNRPR